VVDVAQLVGLPDLQDNRAAVEDELRAAVASQDAFLTEVAGHLVRAGGQRWRPTLAMGAAVAGGGQISSDVIRGACSVELIHLGSLYHDDVMDEADTRRGVDSVNARWGNLVAILAGDYLLARASDIGASLGTEVAGLLAQTIGRLCEGQVIELQRAFDSTRSEDQYFAAIRGKTAALFATSCRVGALCAHLPAEHVQRLTEFGDALGVVYQITDDVHDLTLTEDELGKPAGHDLIEGVYTLPVIHALALPEIGDELRPLLTTSIGRPEADKAIQIVRSSGAIQSALATGAVWAGRASDALASLPPTDHLRALHQLGTSLLRRAGGV
jgi:heptaprenyl diphosphate synthase